MIPVFNLRQFPSIDLRQIGSVPDSAWEEDGSPDPSNQEYGESHEVTAAELNLLLEWEARELRRLDRESASPEAFEEGAGRVVSDPEGIDWDTTEFSRHLDFGIVSCVAALNFLGARTTSSCRGHYGNRYGRDVPYARFIGADADEAIWELILTSAWGSGCQLVGYGHGLIDLIGHSCAELLAFSQVVRDAQRY